MDKDQDKNALLECHLVRSKPDMVNREDQFLKGLISIGWPVDTSFEGLDWSEIKKALGKKYGKDNVKSLHVSQCYNFKNIPIHSIVLTPSLKDPSQVHVLKTLSSYEYDFNRESDGNPHTIRAVLLKTIQKTCFSDQVQRSIKAARRPVTRFSKYSTEIVDAVGRDIMEHEPTEIPELPKVENPKNLLVIYQKIFDDLDIENRRQIIKSMKTWAPEKWEILEADLIRRGAHDF